MKTATTRVIEAPEEHFKQQKHKLFLAGGISNCPDWQQTLIKKVENFENLTLFNPRRKVFPMHDPAAAKQQITWEFNRLAESTAIVVWFSAGSINPIVLYELGMWVNSRPELPAFIGIDPGYNRAQDVTIQTKLARPDITIVSSLDALALQINKYFSAS